MHALAADFKFQWKQGFFVIYGILTLMYIVILSFLPDDWLAIMVPIVVFSDPVVLGMFFIGGIMLLEQMQGILMVVMVSPLRIKEYLLSKTITLSLISVLASIGITVLSYHGDVQWGLLLLAVIQSSVFFTLFGIVIGAGCRNVNHYFVKLIPYVLLLVLPCFSLIGFSYSWLISIIPSVAALRMLIGAYQHIGFLEASVLFSYLTIVNIAAFHYTARIFEQKMIYNDDRI